MICFLAFVLRTVFYKKLKMEDRDMSYSKVMASVRALRTCEFNVKGERVKFRTELEPGASLAFQSLRMRPPNHILSKISLENIVVRQAGDGGAVDQGGQERAEVDETLMSAVP